MRCGDNVRHRMERWRENGEIGGIEKINRERGGLRAHIMTIIIIIIIIIKLDSL